MAVEEFGGFVGSDYTQNNRPRVGLGNALVRCFGYLLGDVLLDADD